MQMRQRHRFAVFSLVAALSLMASAQRFSTDTTHPTRTLSSTPVNVREELVDFDVSESEDDLPLPGFEQLDKHNLRYKAKTSKRPSSKKAAVSDANS